MTEAIYPQCRVVPERLLNPDTVERLLNLLVDIQSIRKILIKGSSLPPAVPYGPARGAPNPHSKRGTIMVGEQPVEIRVHVGIIDMELEDRDALPQIKAACEEVFTEFSYSIKEGRFMKTQASTSDYAKYGPDADELLLGLADPKSRKGPIIVQGT
jgi:methyl-coenzyme M reductase subunit D